MAAHLLFLVTDTRPSGLGALQEKYTASSNARRSAIPHADAAVWRCVVHSGPLDEVDHNYPRGPSGSSKGVPKLETAMIVTTAQAATSCSSVGSGF